MKTAAVMAKVGFRNILFATDFSEAAAKAIPYVKGIARHYEAEIFAFHVRPPAVNVMSRPSTWAYDVEIAKVEDQAHRKELLETFPGGRTRVLIEEGPIQPEIEKAIENNEIDLVVLGTYGRSGLGKLLLGSVAEEIFRDAKCPVLTVGPNVPAAAKAAGEFHEILFATNYGEESREAVGCAIALAQEFHARLALMHVIPERKTGDLVSPHEVAEAARELLRKMVPLEAEVGCRPEFIVERGDPTERILRTAWLRKSDLIVIGAKAESGVPGAATHLGISTAHKVVSQATCPVLTVRR